MTKDEIYSVFDGGDPEIALMKLAVSFPAFGRCELEDVLRVIAASEDEYGKNLLSSRQIGKSFAVPSFSSRGKDALRTIFFIMFNTGLWDGEILFQPGFLPFVHGMKTKLAARDKAAGYRDRWTSDLYEAFAELEDRLVEKIRNKSEGMACLGSTSQRLKTAEIAPRATAELSAC